MISEALENNKMFVYIFYKETNQAKMEDEY